MAANIAKAKAVNGNFNENDDYEKMQFYYCLLYTSRGNVQIETPKKCTTTMTVYVGSECDASMPNGTQARESHVGLSLIHI